LACFPLFLPALWEPWLQLKLSALTIWTMPVHWPCFTSDIDIGISGHKLCLTGLRRIAAHPHVLACFPKNTAFAIFWKTTFDIMFIRTRWKCLSSWFRKQDWVTCWEDSQMKTVSYFHWQHSSSSWLLMGLSHVWVLPFHVTWE
jgi:hypothetical protein